jgi:hypothetical protein
MAQSPPLRANEAWRTRSIEENVYCPLVQISQIDVRNAPAGKFAG